MTRGEDEAEETSVGGGGSMAMVSVKGWKVVDGGNIGEGSMVITQGRSMVDVFPNMFHGFVVGWWCCNLV